jgi:hypothetical protein
MKSRISSRSCRCLHWWLLAGTFMFLVSQTCLLGGEQGTVEHHPELDVRPFSDALQAQSWEKALSLGDTLFAELERSYSGDAGFTAFKSRLTAAEFLARQMQQQLKRATGAQVATVADGLFDQKANSPQRHLSVTPAKQFYDTTANVFARPAHVERLTDKERSFLTLYYDLKLRTLIEAIARAGQALSLVEPQFQGTHSYVLVLPLLHASQRGPINMKVLPEWMQQPSQLLVASDSCLLHFELPFQAMVLARRAAELQGAAFSELEFYKSAARRSGTSRPHLATACLTLALACIPETEIEARMALEFEILQVWLDSENYGLAAGYARKIRTTYADHPETGRAIWLYHYALSRDGNAKDILADVDTAIADARCVPYRAKLLYIKWWALRHQRDQQARVEVLEVALLKEFRTDPMVAPILLSRATDALARQDYGQARTMLADLLERFPQTKAATQAQRMLDKLRTVDGVKEGQP